MPFLLCVEAIIRLVLVRLFQVTNPIAGQLCQSRVTGQGQWLAVDHRALEHDKPLLHEQFCYLDLSVY